jgi:hypothetical protein
VQRALAARRRPSRALAPRPAGPRRRGSTTSSSAAGT